MKYLGVLTIFTFLAYRSYADPVCIQQSGESSTWFGGGYEFINGHNLLDDIFSNNTEYLSDTDQSVTNGVVVGSTITYSDRGVDPENNERVTTWELVEYRSGSSRYETETCVSTDDVLINGINTAKVDFDFFQSSNNYTARAELINSIGRNLTICSFSGYRGDGSSVPTCEASFDITLEDVAPDLSSEIEAAEDFVERYIVEATNRENAYEQRIIDVNNALIAINGKDFNEILAGDLQGVEEALVLYRSIRSELAVLDRDAEIASIMLADAWEDASIDVDNALISQGIDINNLPEFSVPDLEGIAQLIGDNGVLVNNIGSYDYFATTAIATLSQYVSAGDNLGFTLAARDYLNLFKRMIAPLESSSEEISAGLEWQAANDAFEKFENYVFSIVDEDFWFLDSPVTLEQRESIEYISNYDASYGEMIEHSLKSWRSSEMTPEMENLLVLVEAAGKGIQADVASGSSTDYSSLLSGLSTFVRENAVCFSSAIVAGDAGDFYEFVIGKDLCTGEDLSIGERALSGVGLVFANGQMLRAAAKTTGILPSGRMLMKFTAEMKDKATRMGLSQTELDGLAKRINKTFPCT